MKIKITSNLMALVLLLLIGCKSYHLSDVKANDRIQVSQQTSQDSTLTSMIEPYKLEMAVKMDSVIGFAPEALERNRPESNLGNFVADLTYKYGYQYLIKENKAADSSNVFCLLNHGGLRSVISKGNITVGDCYTLMPFENEIVVVEITGKKLLEIHKYLEQSGGEPIANLNLGITVFSNTKRDIECSIGGVEFNPDRNYFVVTSDYLAKGGDKMNFFKDPISYVQTGMLLRDAIIEEVKTTHTITSTLDGRLKINKDE